MNNYLRTASLAAALLFAAPANAAVLTYTYHGQPLASVAVPGYNAGAWGGSFVIDEALLPGGSINGQSFSFTWTEAPQSSWGPRLSDFQWRLGQSHD
jgi:hypothetical protein